MSNINIIRKENIEDIMELTETQQGMLYHYIKDINNEEYQEQICLSISGKIDIEVLKSAWNYVVKNNEMLRAVYKWDKLNKPVQIILRKYIIPFKVIDLSKEDDDQKDILFKEILERDRNEKIDIREESIRITICKIENSIFKIIIKNHHILYDGWSNGIILKEFVQAYNNYLENKEPVNPIKNKFKEFIKWNKQQDKNKQEEYWKDYFENFECIDTVFSANTITTEKKQICEYSSEIPNILRDKIQIYAKEKQVSVAAVLYGAWAILQQKYQDSQDVVFGITVSGRTNAIKGIENIVGLFINTIPLRVRTNNSSNIDELIRNIENSLRVHEEFENTSLVDIKSYGKFQHNKNPFDNIVVIENYPLDKTMNQNSNIKIDEFSISEMTNFNFAFQIITFDKLKLKVSYNNQLFKNEFVVSLTEQYENILNEIAINNSVDICDMEIITEKEKNKLLYEFNNTDSEYPKYKTIHELFEEQVEKVPDNIAVSLEDKKLTYRELNEKANRLAKTLREKEVKENNIVGVMVERSLDMIVAIIGILKAGGAYLPIDPEYPEDRIKYMLQDSGTSILLTQEKFIGKIDFNGEMIDLTDEKTYAYEDGNLENVNDSSDLAYVIYTSGSTGKPKGVMIENKALNNFIWSLVNIYNGDFGENDKCLSLTNVVFDVSVCEMFISLTTGATLVINNKHTTFEISEITSLITDKEITFAYIPPSLLNEVYESLKMSNKKIKLNKLLVGVEPINNDVLERYLSLNKDMQIVNGYGPTETTICATFYKFIGDITGTKTVPIGKPLKNTKIYIVDKNEKLQPIGGFGEIYISGAGIAQGYLNNPELTLEKFIENPFTPDEKVYKTGDLARWLPDGNIEFLGRIDNQVKVRGFRVELGEIENQLLNYEGINGAVVIDREDKYGVKYLCAYIVANKEITVEKLREHLLNNLPQYMIPSYFVHLDKIPLTASGKINRKILPEPEKNVITEVKYEAPRNMLEETLVNIWKDVLSIDNIGINDSFFELGGHSLKATILVSRIHKELNVEIPIKELFRNPTIKKLSQYISTSSKNIYEAIEKTEKRENYPLSSSQQRMYLINKLSGENTNYNMPAVMVIEGKIHKDKFEDSFKKLISRHEAFRTRFEMLEGNLVQIIEESVDFQVNYIEIEENHIEEKITEFIKPFDLSKAPLIRVELIKKSEEEHLLVIDMHHIISDGTSVGIIIKEFSKLYNGENLEELRIQYKDYAVWQKKVQESGELKKQEKYWIKQFTGEETVLNLPTDYQRPLVQSFKGDSVKFQLGKEIVDKLNKLAKENNATMYMVLLAAYNTLLYRYTGQEEIVVGSPTAGRPHVDLENIVGVFINVVAMKNKPKGEERFCKFLKDVRENALNSYKNQDYQIEELIEKLDIKKDTSRNPLFDTMLNFLNTEEVNPTLGELKIRPYKYEHMTSKLDMTLIAKEVNGTIDFVIEYSTSLFRKETVERFSKHFVNILRDISMNPDKKLYEINMLSQLEKTQLLYELNDTYVEYPRNKTMHKLIEEQVERTPDNIAVIFEDKQLTYRQLNEKSNQLARALKEEYGVMTGDIVGIHMDHSLELVISILAVIKANAVCLPTDIKCPVNRIINMFKDSKAKVILNREDGNRYGEFNTCVFNLNSNKFNLYNPSNLNEYCKPDDVAYLIYTSGSTGKPKAVMLTHGSINNHTFAEITYQKVSEKGNYCYNLGSNIVSSTWSLFAPLFVGAKIFVYRQEISSNPYRLFEKLEKDKINVVEVVTPLLNSFLDLPREKTNTLNLENLEGILVGGEKVTPELVNKFYERYDITLINAYGQSECSADTLHYFIPHDTQQDKVLIGKPISNIQIYILGDKDQVQPMGVYGELCISGDSLAKGYLNNPEITNEKFVQNPFVSGKKMFRTGDLVRWLSNENVECIGRKDHQVKIRGFRIELAEIEAELEKHEDIKELVVIAKEDENGENRLCAYFTAQKELSVVELRGWLSLEVPEYMIPSYFVQLDEMPLNSNGKIDRKLLPEPKMKINTGREYVEPRNNVEEKLTTIWKEVLSIKRVGIHDNFFEIGGNSLNIIKTNSKINEIFNIEIPITTMFRYSNISSLAQYINNSKPEMICKNKENRSEKMQKGKDRLKKVAKKRLKN